MLFRSLSATLRCLPQPQGCQGGLVVRDTKWQLHRFGHYDNSGYANESYVDSYGNVLGSAAGDTLNEISFTAIKALDFGEVSAVITGDDSDRAAYVAVYQRLEIEEEFACEKGTVSETLFSVPYVGATVNTPYFTRYTLMTESFAQNMACTPVSEKVYDRIAINTLY